MAHALQVPMYQLFYDGEKPPELPNLIKRKSADEIVWGVKSRDARWLAKLRRLLGRMSEHDRNIVMFLVQKMAKGSARSH
jgi:hypothetical protein